MFQNIPRSNRNTLMVLSHGKFIFILHATIHTMRSLNNVIVSVAFMSISLLVSCTDLRLYLDLKIHICYIYHWVLKAMAETGH